MHRFAVTAIATLLLTGAPARADLLINVSKAQQRLSVTVNGHKIYRWPISTGRGRYATPAGTWRPTRLEKNWYSRKYDMAPMPYSVFFHRGYAVHGTTELSALGRPASHGCVRLDPANASILFNLVKRYGSRNTKVVVLNGALPSAPPAPRNDPVAKLADAGDDAAEAPKLVSAQPAAKPKPAKVAHNENLQRQGADRAAGSRAGGQTGDAVAHDRVAAAQRVGRRRGQGVARARSLAARHRPPIRRHALTSTRGPRSRAV